MMGVIPNPKKYKGVESIEHFISRINSFMESIKGKYDKDETNILIVGHKCTVGAIDAYFSGFKDIKQSMKNASKNGEYKIY